jgi:hypothetical protein
MQTQDEKSLQVRDVRDKILADVAGEVRRHCITHLVEYLGDTLRLQGSYGLQVAGTADRVQSLMDAEPAFSDDAVLVEFFSVGELSVLELMVGNSKYRERLVQYIHRDGRGHALAFEAHRQMLAERAAA